MIAYVIVISCDHESRERKCKTHVNFRGANESKIPYLSGIVIQLKRDGWTVKRGKFLLQEAFGGCEING